MELQILTEKYLGRGKMQSNGEHYVFCPFCHHKNPKLVINYTKKIWHCFVCNASGRLLKLFSKIGASKEDLQKIYTLCNEVRRKTIDIRERQLHLPDGFRPLWESTNTLNYKRILHYAKSRGILIEDIYRYNIGYSNNSPFYGHIIIPSYNKLGELNYFIARNVEDGYQKYRNCSLPKNEIIMFESLVDWKSPLVLCEGVFDAINIRRNVIPLLGKFISDVLFEEIVYNDVPEVVIALDNDAYKNAKELTELFYKEGKPVKLIELTSEDDAADLGFTAMSQKINAVDDLNFKDLVEAKLR